MLILQYIRAPYDGTDVVPLVPPLVWVAAEAALLLHHVVPHHILRPCLGERELSALRGAEPSREGVRVRLDHREANEAVAIVDPPIVDPRRLPREWVAGSGLRNGRAQDEVRAR